MEIFNSPFPLERIMVNVLLHWCCLRRKLISVVNQDTKPLCKPLKKSLSFAVFANCGSYKKYSAKKKVPEPQHREDEGVR